MIVTSLQNHRTYHANEDRHLSNVMAKLDAPSRKPAAHYAPLASITTIRVRLGGWRAPRVGPKTCKGGLKLRLLEMVRAGRARTPTRPEVLAAGVVVVLLLAVATRYGYHRDELYFIAAGRRPAWGYIDQPPFTPLVTAFADRISGGSLWAIRVLPALAVGAVVLLGGGLARTFARGSGGGLGAVLVALTPVILSLGHLSSTATFDLLFWMLVLYAVARRLAGGAWWWWLVAGAVGGAGMLNKHTIALLGLSLAVGLVANDRRRLREPALYVGVLLALVIALPNLVWQAPHGWPQLEMAGALRQEHGGALGALLLIGLLLLTLNPLLIPAWARGVRWLTTQPGAAGWRALAVAAPACLLILLLAGGQFYYVAPMGLMLLAAGAAATQPSDDFWGRPLAARAAVAAAASLPVSLPLLPPATADVLSHVNETLGEQIGWPELVATVAAGWESLDDTSEAVILTRNYGQAGAIERYGSRHGLPLPYSGHNSYWWWGPPPDDRDRILLVGYQEDHTRGWCAQYEVLRTFATPHGVSNEEDGTPIATCVLARQWTAAWAEIREYR